jgi:hypothetical protein
VRRLLVSFLVLLSVATSIGLLSVSRYRLGENAADDIRGYVAIQRGDPISEVAPPFRYRVLTPLLARAVPAPPASLFRDRRNLDDRTVVFRFAVVNTVGLAAAAWFLLLLMDAMGFEPWQSLVGSLLFLGSFQILLAATLPRVDAWGYAFLVGCLWALVSGRPVLLLAMFSLGMFNKETILLVPLAVLLLKQPRRARIVQFGCLIPGLVAYFVFRVLLLPAEWPLYSTASTSKFVAELFGSAQRLGHYTSRSALVYGLLWLLAAWGWARNRHRADHPLIRWSWIVPVVLVIPFALALTIHSMWAFAFPFVIPLAVWGLRDLWDEGRSAESGR